MYHLKFLYRENDLNKVIKKQKRSKENIKILFVSLWDKWSQNLVNDLKSKYSTEAEENSMPLYVVDSFSMPHSFVIFKSSVLPHLVTLKRNKVFSEDYLPMVYKELDLE